MAVDLRNARSFFMADELLDSIHWRLWVTRCDPSVAGRQEADEIPTSGIEQARHVGDLPTHLPTSPQCWAQQIKHHHIGLAIACQRRSCVVEHFVIKHRVPSLTCDHSPCRER